jgi:hypothetical protein
MVPTPVALSCFESSLAKNSSATSQARKGGFSSITTGRAPIGDDRGFNEDTLDEALLGVDTRDGRGDSARSEEEDDFLPSEGEEERCKLATLGLRCRGLEGKPGEEGSLCVSEGRRGEFKLDEWEREALVAV